MLVNQGITCLLGQPQVIHHPEQLKNLKELVTMQTYVPINIDELRAENLYPIAFRLDSLVQAESQFINVSSRLRGGDIYNRKLLLADYGIMPYQCGKWNPFNFIVPLRVFKTDLMFKSAYENVVKKGIL